MNSFDLRGDRGEGLRRPHRRGEVGQRRAVGGRERGAVVGERGAVEVARVIEIEAGGEHLHGEEPGQDPAQVVEREVVVPARAGEDDGRGLALQGRGGLAPPSALGALEEVLEQRAVGGAVDRAAEDDAVGRLDGRDHVRHGGGRELQQRRARSRRRGARQDARDRGARAPARLGPARDPHDRRGHDAARASAVTP